MRAAAYALAIIAVGALPGCVEEPTVKDAEKAVTAIEQNEVKKKQLTIEQAADEATKLIEADARQESEASSANTDSD